jgi:hypothetical protein
MSGEMQALKNPTPVPNKIRPRMKDARAPFGDAITCGIAAMRMRMCPKVATTIATYIVLNFPQYSSASHPPRMMSIHAIFLISCKTSPIIGMM